MKRFSQNVVCVALAIAGATNHASAQDVCQALLDHGINNTLSIASTEDQKAYAFSKYCHSSGQTKSIDASSKISAVVGGFAGFFNESGSYSSSSHVQFCKNNTRYDSYRSQNFGYIQSVSTTAVNAWSDCVRAQAQEVEFDAKYGATPASNSAFSLRYVGSSAGVKVSMVKYDEALLHCVGTSSQNGTGDPEEIKMNTLINLDLKNRSINVVCRRFLVTVDEYDQLRRQKSEERVAFPENRGLSELDKNDVLFPETNVVFLTDKGSLLGVFYREFPEMLPKSHFKALSQRIDALSQRINAIGSTAGGSCYTTGWKDKAKLHQTFYCRDGYYVRGTEFKHPHGQDYAYQESVRHRCCKLPAAN